MADPNCFSCSDTGVIETGNNDMPCSCPAGNTAKFNVAGRGLVSGAQLKSEEGRPYFPQDPRKGPIPLPAPPPHIAYYQEVWSDLLKYRTIENRTKEPFSYRLEFKGVPGTLVNKAFGIVIQCVECRRPSHPIRSRAKSLRSRIARTDREYQLYYSPTCQRLPGEENDCSKCKKGKDHFYSLACYLKYYLNDFADDDRVVAAP